jgi:hypothetical protein
MQEFVYREKLMWNMKFMIQLVIIRASGIVTKGLKKDLETIPGKHSIDSIQNTAVLGTSHIIRTVLQPETWSFSSGDQSWFRDIPGTKVHVKRK